MYAVTIEPLDAIYFLGERPEGSRWDVQGGVEIDAPPSHAEWPDGAPAPEEVLCVSVSDPKRYKVFRCERDVDPAEFRETGRAFGGVYSRTAWKRFEREIDATLATRAVPADEPPGAMEAALHNVGGGR